MASRKTIRRRAARRRAAHRRADAAAWADAAANNDPLEDQLAAAGRGLIETRLREAWPGAPELAVRLGRHVVLEIMRNAAETGPEIYWRDAIKLLVRATCAAVAHRPPGDRNLLATIRRIGTAARLERRVARGA